MRIVNRLLWGIIIVAMLASELAYKAYAQSPSQSFQGTNYTVSGEFLEFYRSISDPYAILGFPISPEMEEPVSHYTVQYFQLGRLELHPDEPPGQRVHISDLGLYLYKPGAPIPANVPTRGPNCRLFPATGKSVCLAFLQFYDKYGAKYFGNPISQVEFSDGRYIQYFEKAAMEWRPESPEGRRVGLSDLGERYLSLINGQIDNSAPSWIPNGRPLRIQVRAFTQQALIPANSGQTLFVVVQDEKLNPVPNAAISVKVSLPNRHENYRPPVTDQDGISVFSFNVGAVDVKQIVNIEVTANVNGLEENASTSFRVWW